MKQKYKGLIEITLHEADQKLSTRAYDLIETKKARRVAENGAFEEGVLYILGEKDGDEAQD